MADGGKVIIKIDGDDSGFKKTASSSKSQAAKLAAEYRKSGMSQSDAMKKAWSEIERTSNSSSNKVVKDIKSIGQTAEVAGKDISHNLSGGLSKISSGLGKVGTAALKGFAVGATATATAIVGIGTAAIKSYAEYEQLVGGVDTLFKSSSQTIQQYAAEAYKTAGMSANTYMSTVTSFSASLINSVGGDTARAAEMANMAVQDMSDNANKMGTSLDTVRETYQSIARGNYEMLDNLKLGYGGTKTELERLLKDAEKYKAAQGEMKDYSVDSFADIVEAIHVVQENMGITGTTAEEAASTIQGSFNTMKAAWENVLTGIADPNQDFDVLIDNLVSSIDTFAGNIQPRIENALVGITQLISELSPRLIQMVQNILPELLPSVVDGATNIGNAILEALPGIVNTIVEAVPAIVEGLSSLIQKIASQLPTLLPAILEGITKLVTEVTESFPEVIDTILKSLSDLMPKLGEGIVELISALSENASTMADVWLENLPEIFNSIVQTIVDNAPKIMDSIADKDGEIMIEKKYTITDTDILATGKYVITLASSETKLLKLENIYLFRFSFIDSNENADTALSGNLIVEW